MYVLYMPVYLSHTVCLYTICLVQYVPMCVYFTVLVGHLCIAANWLGPKDDSCS